MGIDVTHTRWPFDPARLMRYALDVWRTDRQGSASLAARQRTRVAEIIAFTRARSPYYRELYSALPSTVTDVQQLPVTTKPELMAHFDAWVTDPKVTRSDVDGFLADLRRVGDLFRGNYAVWTTSGTTGRPGVFLHDRGALAAYAALVLRRDGGLRGWARQLAGVVRRGVRSAVVVATGGHFAAAAGAALAQKSVHWGRDWFRVFSVVDPLPQLVRDLNAFRPTALMGYATILGLLAQEQRVGRLAIHPFSITSLSEGLDPSVRGLVHEVFGCPVQDLYGASEFPDIAFECSHDRLHVNADWVIVEPVDNGYQPVAPGLPSRTTLLTNLANRVAPLLRYDLGDSITLLGEPCPCGSALPAIRVEGRRDEVLFLQTGSDSEVAVLPMALGTVIEETPGVEMFQAVQTGPAELHIRLAAHPGRDEQQVWAALVQRIQAFLMARGLGTVRIVRDPTVPGRDPRTGKLRHVWVEERAGQAVGHFGVPQGASLEGSGGVIASPRGRRS